MGVRNEQSYPTPGNPRHSGTHVWWWVMTKTAGRPCIAKSWGMGMERMMSSQCSVSAIGLLGLTNALTLCTQRVRLRQLREVTMYAAAKDITPSAPSSLVSFEAVTRETLSSFIAVLPRADGGHLLVFMGQSRIVRQLHPRSMLRQTPQIQNTRTPFLERLTLACHRHSRRFTCEPAP